MKSKTARQCAKTKKNSNPRHIMSRRIDLFEYKISGYQIRKKNVQTVGATLRLGCCDLLQESLLRLLLLLQTLSPTLPLLKAYHTYYTTLPHLLHTYCLIHTYYTLLRLLLQTLSYSHTTKSSKVHTSIVHYCSFELEQVRQPTYFCLLLPHLR